MQVTSVETTSITITWVAPAITLANRISYYNVLLTESEENGTNFTQAVTGTSYTFTGLQEYTNYTYVITAVSIYGPVSVATAPVTETTLESGMYNDDKGNIILT